MQKTERRFYTGEIRAEENDGKKYLVGVAATYGTLSLDLGGWRERLEAGCFMDSLDAGDDIVHLVNHNRDLLLGRTSSGSLQLTDGPRALRYKTELPDTTYARDLSALASRGDFNESSFAFTCLDDTWSTIDDPDSGEPIGLRTVHAARLHDVSTVFSGAYPKTDAQLADRSLPTSMPQELRARLGKRAANDDDDDDPQQCTCDCAACLNGDCDGCDPASCQDPENCRCQERSARGAGDSKIGRMADELFAAIADMSDEDQASALVELQATAKRHGLEIGDAADDDEDIEANRARRLAVELETW